MFQKLWMFYFLLEVIDLLLIDLIYAYMYISIVHCRQKYTPNNMQKSRFESKNLLYSEM